MNARYFGCENCKTYCDAGYRWAYWLLEEAGVVTIGERVVVDEVLRANSYWNPPPEEQNDWLCGRILPAVRSYLTEHHDHELVYIEEDFFDPDGPFSDWTDVSAA